MAYNFGGAGHTETRSTKIAVRDRRIITTVGPTALLTIGFVIFGGV